LFIYEAAKTIELKSIHVMDIAVPTIKNIIVESKNDAFELSIRSLSLSNKLNILSL
jgi:hypothetical protein